MPIDESHPVLKISKENYTLWRYMDIPSFLSLLTSSSLTFVRADILEDKFEGKFPKPTAEYIDFQVEKLNRENGITVQSKFSQILEASINKDIYLNCWCIANHEMVHMWKIYSKEHGVAIQTTYLQLKKSILSEETVYPTEIEYLDYKSDFLDWKSNGLKPFTIKRKEYNSEREFRLMIPFPRIIEEKAKSFDSGDTRHAKRLKLYEETPVIKCSVNFRDLIHKIHISPYAPEWYYEIILKICKKYDINDIEIIKSDL